VLCQSRSAGFNHKGHKESAQRSQKTVSISFILTKQQYLTTLNGTASKTEFFEKIQFFNPCFVLYFFRLKTQAFFNTEKNSV